MSCNTRYWCSMAMAQKDKPANPALAKENNDGLKAIMAAREAQDRAFDYRSQQLPAIQQVSNQNHQQNPK